MGLLTPIEDPLNDWDNLPLSHTRIGYEQKLTAISGGTSSFALKALTPNTYERWTDASGSMIGTFDIGSAVDIDYIAIGAHNLSSAQVSKVDVSYSTDNGVGFRVIGSVVPTDDQALMFLFDKVSGVTNIKVAIPNDGSTGREIGVVQAGVALQMYQPIYGGHSPQDLSARTEYQSTRSDSGQFLGRTIIRKGTQASLSFSNLNHEWYREKFQPFVEHAKTKPFFVKWRPDLYETTTYSHTTSDIRPSNSGGGSKNMSVSFSIEGHADSI